MSKLEARKQFIAFMLKEIKKGIANDRTNNTAHPSGKSKGRAKQTLSPSDHYAIAESGRTPTDITVWLGSLQGDRATKVHNPLTVSAVTNTRLGFYR